MISKWSTVKGLGVFLILVSAFLIFNPSAIFAEDPKNMEKAMSLYEKGDFDKAIREFRQIITELKDRSDSEAKSEGLFTANLYIGMSYLGKGKESLAKESLRNAFKAAPHKTLSPELFPPKVITLYSEIVSKNLSSVIVKSNVSDAEVFVDDIKKGNTPLILRDLLPGTHTVKTVYARQEVIKVVSLAPGKDVTITADFQTTGSLSVTSEPAGASLYLDGRPLGTAPLFLKDIAVGEHLLNIRQDGYTESNQKVFIKGNEIIEINVKLALIVYNVKIASQPDAEVFWDEASKGTTPAIIENVTPGIHKIRLVKDGYEEQRDTVDIRTPNTEKIYKITPHTGSLSIKTDPQGVEVIIEDKIIGTTPLSISSLPVKQYAVKLKKKGYRGKDITVVIAKDRVYEVTEMLLETDTQKPDIVPEPPSKAIKENKNYIRARIVDNQAVGEVSLMLKLEGEMNFQRVGMSSSLKGIYEAIIPDLYLKKGAVLEYYISACDLQNNCSIAGSKESPYKLKVISLEPYTEGFIIDMDIENDRVTISIGSVDGVKKGDKFIVFRIGKELRDPKTNELLQIEEFYIGVIKVKELMPRTASAEVDESDTGVFKNDRIRKQAAAVTSVMAEGNYTDRIVLRWAPNREPEVKGYRIYRSTNIDGNYQRTGEVDGRDTTVFEDTENMKEGLVFYYRIAAFNILGNDGLMSEPVTGSTKKKAKAPVGLKGQGGAGKISLKWERNKEPDVKAYNVYEKTWYKSTLLVTVKDNSSELPLEGKVKSITVYVTAVNQDGVESEPSEEIEITLQ